MNNAIFNKVAGLAMFLMGSFGYLEIISDTLIVKNVNFAMSGIFIIAVGAVIFIVFQLRKQENKNETIENIFSIPKINREARKINLLFFLFLAVTLVVILLYLLTNYTFPSNDMYMILFLNLIMLYGLSFVFRILI